MSDNDPKTIGAEYGAPLPAEAGAGSVSEGWFVYHATRPSVHVRTIAARLTEAQIPFILNPEHEAEDLRPWSELAVLGLVENRPPDGPSLTPLGRAVAEVLGKGAR